MERSELELELRRLLSEIIDDTGVDARVFGELKHMGEKARPVVPALLHRLPATEQPRIRLAIIETIARLADPELAMPIVWSEIQRLRRTPDERYLWMATLSIFGGLKPRAYAERLWQLAREIEDPDARRVVVGTLSGVPGFAKLEGLREWLIGHLGSREGSVDIYALKGLRRMRSELPDEMLRPFLDHPVEQAREDARAMLKLNAKRRAKAAANKGR